MLRRTAVVCFCRQPWSHFGLICLFLFFPFLFFIFLFVFLLLRSCHRLRHGTKRKGTRQTDLHQNGTRMAPESRRKTCKPALLQLFEESLRHSTRQGCLGREKGTRATGPPGAQDETGFGPLRIGALPEKPAGPPRHRVRKKALLTPGQVLSLSCRPTASNATQPIIFHGSHPLTRRTSQYALYIRFIIVV